MMRVPFSAACIAALLFVVAGCAGQYSALDDTAPARVGGDTAGGRYAMAQDRPPSRTITADQVQDLVPIYEPPTRGGNSDYTIGGVRYQVMASAEGYRAEGVASWYGEKFHGHTTSNGETYDMYQLSAAHTRLPLPTYVRVTNLGNGREVIVRVNDRGPFHDNRLIDLSYAAAVRLGFADQGTARVRVEALPRSQHAPATAAPAHYWLQFGAFREERTARQFSQQVSAELGQTAAVEEEGGVFRVRMGPVQMARAEELQRSWQSKGNDKPLLFRR
ncbi:MAG: septal ring lytic transglycosylase RlpA family protein [Natronospirillum sp.]